MEEERYGTGTDAPGTREPEGDGRTEVISVRGMFCSNCEQRIVSALEALPGVVRACADRNRETVTVTYAGSGADPETVRKAIRDLGYEVVSGGREGWKNAAKAAAVLAAAFAAFLIGKKAGWTDSVSVFSALGSSAGYGMIFLVGLLTSVHCITMCGGINLTQSTMAAKGGARLSAANLAYNGGRVLSYTILGGILGGIGRLISFTRQLQGILSILVGAAMVLMALSLLGIFRGFRGRKGGSAGDRLYAKLFRRFGSRSSFALGLLNGFMPCGPLQSMQVFAVSTGSVWHGAAAMLLFALGTVPLMFGFGLFSGKLNRKYGNWILTASAALVLCMGLVLVGRGAAVLGGAGTASEAAVRADPAAEVYGDADVDLTLQTMDETILTVFRLMRNPSDYAGKVIRIYGFPDVSQDPETGETLLACRIPADSECCTVGVIDFTMHPEFADAAESLSGDETVVVTGTADTYFRNGMEYCILRDAVITR